MGDVGEHRSSANVAHGEISGNDDRRVAADAALRRNGAEYKKSRQGLSASRFK